jgi:putative flippase GtrA
VRATEYGQSVVLIHHAKRYTKFLMVGAANAIVDLVVLNGLFLLHPTNAKGLLAAYNTVAVLAAIVNSYVLNRRFTFRDKSTGSLREGLMFAVQALVNIVVNDLVVVWLSTYLAHVKNIPILVSGNLAKAIAMMVASSVSFVLMKFVVFRGRPK